MYIHICIHTSNRVSGSVRDSLGIMRKQGASKVSDVANSESSPFCETPANQRQTPFNPSHCHTDARRVSPYSSASRTLRALRPTISKQGQYASIKVQHSLASKCSTRVYQSAPLALACRAAHAAHSITFPLIHNVQTRPPNSDFRIRTKCSFCGILEDCRVLLDPPIELYVYLHLYVPIDLYV